MSSMHTDGLKPEISQNNPHSISTYCLVGLVVKASASRAEDRGFESHLRRYFSGVDSYQ